MVCNDTQIEIDPEVRLQNAVILLYKGVYKKRNPLLGATRDFALTCIIFYIVASTLKIIFGLRYLNDCPVNNYIPFFMALGGILQLLFLIALPFRNKRAVLAFHILIGALLGIWLILAMFNTFIEWEPEYHVISRRYCNKVIYIFAVIMCLSEFVSTILFMFLVCISISFEMR